MTAQHTPGPWEFGVISDMTLEQQVRWYEESLSKGAVKEFGLIDVFGVYIPGTDTPICHTGNGPTSVANARLIAAAPEMKAAILARCPYCQEGRETEQHDGGTWHRVARGGDDGGVEPCRLTPQERAAIAKATQP